MTDSRTSARTVGALMLPVLRPHTPAVAVGYLATRTFEGAFRAYNIDIAGLGIGSLFFCLALYRSRLAPRFLAGWGLVAA